MNRRNFLGFAGGSVLLGGGVYYLLSDKRNFLRHDMEAESVIKISLNSDEKEILYLASLAPSGHNTQPWFIKYIEPYHWIVGNDKSKWLPAVDPTQRETILAIGAFLQNMEYAAADKGYTCHFTALATTNQDENMVEVTLNKSSGKTPYDAEKIKMRRTVRSNYQSIPLKKEDQLYLIDGEAAFFHFLPNPSKEYNWVNEQTIEANRMQAYRDAAQKELASWIRFSSKDAEKYGDGLTTAGMEIEGMPAWVLRNFYNEASVMKKKFREQSIDQVKKQVSQSAGWLLITSKDNSVLNLLETGRRMQKLFLKVRERMIAIHPMTQILEESAMSQVLNKSIGITDTVQFILRTGYLKTYPDPVSIRRPVNRFVRI